MASHSASYRTTLLCPQGGAVEVTEGWLNEEQALLISVLETVKRRCCSGRHDPGFRPAPGNEKPRAREATRGKSGQKR